MNYHRKQQHSGFSLVEFIVILTLFAIMASVVTFDFQRFRTNIDRSNLATDVALAFRQMQVYGISSSNRLIGAAEFESDEGTATVQNLVNADLIQDTSTYGVELNLDQQTMTLFQDNVEGTEGVYDEGGTNPDTLIDILQISGQNSIQRICVTESADEPEILSADASCVFPSGGEEIDSGTFTAVFKRPFPDATYTVSSIPGDFTTRIAVMVIGPDNAQASAMRYVYLDAVGLIQSIRANIVDN
jgi:type II secretory pathway pseudopilin PulG